MDKKGGKCLCMIGYVFKIYEKFAKKEVGIST